MDTNIVLSEIARSLQITKFADESELSYTTRVLYSALGQWMQFSILDDDVYSDTLTERCKTSEYISQKCRNVLSAYSKIYPEISDWFSSSRYGTPVKLILDRYINAGILVSGPGNTYQPAPAKYAEISPSLYYVRGIIPADSENIRCVGLGTFVRKIPDDAELVPISELFKIPDCTAFKFTKDYISLAKFELANEDSDREYFGHSFRKRFSDSWSNKLRPEWRETVYRNRKTNEFGLAKLNPDGSVMTWKFPEYITNNFDTKRIMYGLRVISKNQTGFVIHEKKDYATISLYSSLPKVEETMMYMLAWPVESIGEIANFITTKEFLPVIRKMLRNLNMISGGRI